MKKTRLMSFIAFLMMIMAVLSASVITSFASSAQTDIDSPANQEEAEFYEVISYVDIFECYYDRASESTAQTGTEICGFEEFCDNYYTSNLSISEYSDMVAGGENADENATSRSSSSGDADYILSSTDYVTTPASDFGRAPVVGFL